MVEEKVYRKRVSDVFDRVLKAFDSIDPDIAEAELSQGSLTIVARTKKIIISPQPPVQQIWLAAASLGIAAHFSWDESTKTWVDDKAGPDEKRPLGKDFYSVLTEVLKLSSDAVPSFI